VSDVTVGFMRDGEAALSFISSIDRPCRRGADRDDDRGGRIDQLFIVGAAHEPVEDGSPGMALLTVLLLVAVVRGCGGDPDDVRFSVRCMANEFRVRPSRCRKRAGPDRAWWRGPARTPLEPANGRLMSFRSTAEPSPPR
jgi:hypothetical protein